MKAKRTTKVLITRSLPLTDLISATGKTHKELATLIGVSRPSITNWCNGRFTGFSHVVFKRLASALKVSNDALENALNASKEAHDSAK